MNSAILRLLGPSVAGTPDLDGAKASSASALAADSFGSVLNGKLSVVRAPQTVGAPVNSADSDVRALEAKIAKLRESGASEADIVATLADQLAASIAKTLGTPTAEARASLQSVFAAALAPPDEAGIGAGSLADRLRGLAQRFLKLQTIAAQIAGGRHTGQQNRIAGNILDANAAKELPGPVKTSHKQPASATLKGVAPAASSDERVTFAPTHRAARPPIIQSALTATVSERSPRVLVIQPARLTAGDAPKPVTGPLEKLPMPAGLEELRTPAAVLQPSAVPDSNPEFVAVEETPGSPALKEPFASAGAGKESRAANGTRVRPGGEEPPASSPIKKQLVFAAGAHAEATTIGADKPNHAAGAQKPRPEGSGETPISPDGEERPRPPGREEAPKSFGVHHAAAVGGAPVPASVPELRISAFVKAASPVVKDAAPRIHGLQSAGEPAVDGGSAPRETPGGAAVSAAVTADARAAVIADSAGSARPGLLSAEQRFADERDGRTVRIGRSAAVSTGGDTTLGRVLSRAVAAAALRSPDGPDVVPDAGASATAPGADSGAAAGATSGTGDANESTAAGHPATNAAAPDAVLAAFVKSFEAALSTAPKAARAAAHTDVPAALSAPAAALPQADNVPATLAPSAAPFSIEAPVRTAATPAPLPVYTTPVDQSAIADQVLRGISLRNTGASSEIRLSLVPQSLGDVKVQLVVSAGNVNAHVVAQTPEVRDALVAAQPQLTKSLADAGLKLQAFTVDLSGNGFAGFSQRHTDHSPSGNTTGRAAGISVDDIGDADSADASLDAVPSFGPSVSATARGGAYNYLA